MFEKYKIIVDSGRTKQRLFLFFDLKESFVILATMIVIYFIASQFSDGILPIVFGIGFAVIVGFLFIEMPNHMNIWQHIKLVYRYFLVEPNAYYYFKARKKKEVIKHVKKTKKQGNKNIQEEDKGFTHS